MKIKLIPTANLCGHQIGCLTLLICVSVFCAVTLLGGFYLEDRGVGKERALGWGLIAGLVVLGLLVCGLFMASHIDSVRNRPQPGEEVVIKFGDYEGEKGVIKETGMNGLIAKVELGGKNETIVFHSWEFERKKS